MPRIARYLAVIAASSALLLTAQDEDKAVFRSDVSLARVDAQVVDGGNRAITHLNAEDFVLRLDGRVLPIRNFASEGMPVDVLFLLDVSASMRPHVQRIADASGQALTVLGKDDRIGVMVFDRSTRVRLAFNSSPQEAQREFDRLLRQERFNGGTDITRAMLDAADYIGRNGRRDARRAIVILTDDQTEFDRDEAAVGRALGRADAIMCALIAPDAMQTGRYPGGGGGGPPRGTWGSGGGIGGGGPLGGVILGPRSRGPGSRYPGGGGGMGTPRTKSAGTAEIARDSGGDSMSVNDASALEDTLSRIRQRYTLYFNMPDGVRQNRDVQVDLAASARRRYSDADVHYRRVSMSANGGSDAAPTHVTRAPSNRDYSTSSASSADQDYPPVRKRRPAVNEDGTMSIPDDPPSPAANQR